MFILSTVLNGVEYFTLTFDESLVPVKMGCYGYRGKYLCLFTIYTKEVLTHNLCYSIFFLMDNDLPCLCHCSWFCCLLSRYQPEHFRVFYLGNLHCGRF